MVFYFPQIVIWRSLLQSRQAVPQMSSLLSLLPHPQPPLSVVYLSISMLMPCNDLRHVGMKKKERNLFPAQLCSAFCCCCHSNTDQELKLTQQCLFAWQDKKIIFFLDFEWLSLIIRSIKNAQPAVASTY